MFAVDVQVVDAAMALALHQDACRNYSLVAWVIMWDDPAFPGRYIARLATKGPLPYVLIGETLSEIQAQLPPGLEHFERQSVHSPEVVEIWFAP